MLTIPDNKNRTSGMKDYHENGTEIKKSNYKPKTTLSEYLNEGKIGDRNIKDQRIPLIGDLDIFEETAKIATSKGSTESYRNWVLSFQEDNISVKHLQEITQSFIDMYTVGYKDEIVVCAEIHKPKIKFKVKDGKRIKRHLHVHISFSKYSPKLDRMLDLGHHGLHVKSGGRQREADIWSRWTEKKYNLKTTLKPIQLVYQNKLSTKNEMREALYAYCDKQAIEVNNLNELIANLREFDCIKNIKKSVNAKIPYITVIFENEKHIRLKGNLYSDYGFKDAKNKIIEKEKIKYDPLSVSEPKDIPMPEEFVKLQEARFDKITKDLAKKRAEHVDILSDLIPMQMDETYKEWITKKEYKTSEIVSPLTAYTENIKSEQKANIELNFYNQKVDARLLLQILQDSHHINNEIYYAFINKAGEFRIEVGTHKYSVSEFLQKEMNFNWDEVVKTLVYVHKQQKNHSNIQTQKTNIYQRMSYQNKVFIDIYHSNTNLDLSSFYISKTSDKTILRKQGISIEDTGDALQSQFTQDVKAQVELMIELARAKEWDLEDIEISGTDVFRQEVLKQINEQKEEEKDKEIKTKTRRMK